MKCLWDHFSLASLGVLLVVAVASGLMAFRLIWYRRTQAGLLSPTALRIWGVFFALASLRFLVGAMGAKHWLYAIPLLLMLAGAVYMTIATFALAQNRERARRTALRPADEAIRRTATTSSSFTDSMSDRKEGKLPRWQRRIVATVGITLGFYIFLPATICGCHFHVEAAVITAVPLLWGVFALITHRDRKEQIIGWIAFLLGLLALWAGFDSNLVFFLAAREDTRPPGNGWLRLRWK